MHSFRHAAFVSVLALHSLAADVYGNDVDTTTAAVAAPTHHFVDGETVVSPTLLLKVPAARLRMPVDMDATARAAPALPFRIAPFRPTVPLSEYLAAKAAPRRSVRDSRPEILAPVGPQAATLQQFEGTSQTAGFPPDTHGAVGLSHFVEVTNSTIDIYLKTTGALARRRSLASLFGYFSATLFDPRAIYDRTWNRWVITAEAFPESASVQRFFIAVSQTRDPLGAYFIFSINATTVAGSNNFFDFPQLGMDQDSIIITGNIFGPSTFLGWRMFAIAKARLYNGLSFATRVFRGSVSDATLAPPIVLDQNAKTFLIAAPVSGSALKLYALRESSRTTGATLTGPINVPVPTYTPPPPAPQCGGAGGAAELDTSDARFVNASTQNGNFLWNVHSIDFGGAAVRWYRINTSTNTVNKTATFSASATSADFNASIAANDAGDIALTWTSTSATVCPQVRVAGQSAAAPPGTGATGLALFTSLTRITGNLDPDLGLQRWGDYSAVSIDPSISSVKSAWVVNEKVNSTAAWGSRIGRISLP